MNRSVMVRGGFAIYDDREAPVPLVTHPPLLLRQRRLPVFRLAQIRVTVDSTLESSYVKVRPLLVERAQEQALARRADKAVFKTSHGSKKVRSLMAKPDII